MSCKGCTEWQSEMTLLLTLNTNSEPAIMVTSFNWRYTEWQLGRCVMQRICWIATEISINTEY